MRGLCFIAVALLIPLTVSVQENLGCQAEVLNVSTAGALLIQKKHTLLPGVLLGGEGDEDVGNTTSPRAFKLGIDGGEGDAFEAVVALLEAAVKGKPDGQAILESLGQHGVTDAQIRAIVRDVAQRQTACVSPPAMASLLKREGFEDSQIGAVVPHLTGLCFLMKKQLAELQVSSGDNANFGGGSLTKYSWSFVRKVPQMSKKTVILVSLAFGLILLLLIAFCVLTSARSHLSSSADGSISDSSFDLSRSRWQYRFPASFNSSAASPQLQLTEEEAARAKAAEEESARVQAAEEEAARAKAGEEVVARAKAAVEEVARAKAVEEEAARVKAAEEEADQVKVAGEKAAIKAAQEVAARLKAAEEEAARVQTAEEEAARAKAAEEVDVRAKAAEEEVARAKAAEEVAARAKAAEEEVARAKAAEEETARAKAAEEKADRVKAAEEEAARVKAAEEEAARVKAAEEEAARVNAAEEEADRVNAAEEEAARVKAAEEAARVHAAEKESAGAKAADEEASRAKAAEEEAARIEGEAAAATSSNSGCAAVAAVAELKTAQPELHNANSLPASQSSTVQELAKGGEEDWPEALLNMQARFPNIGADTVANVLRDHRGHAGKASAAIRKLFPDGVQTTGFRKTASGRIPTGTLDLLEGKLVQFGRTPSLEHETCSPAEVLERPNVAAAAGVLDETAAIGVTEDDNDINDYEGELDDEELLMEHGAPSSEEIRGEPNVAATGVLDETTLMHFTETDPTMPLDGCDIDDYEGELDDAA